MNIIKCIRKMHTIVKRSIFLSVVVIIFVLCLFYGVFGSGLKPDKYKQFSEKENWYHNKEIIMVHALFRHCHRTPADTYPNDPHINETFFPYGWGHLTNQGKDYCYDTGSYLKTRYEDFLGSYYFPDLIQAQTTGVTRTKMSMGLVLAGLFPPKNTPMEWNKKLNWQPIPIDYEPLEKDSLLLVRTSCPRYQEAVNAVLTSDPVKSEIDQWRPMMEELTKITGLNITTPDDVQSLYNTLRTEQEYGLTLPAWTKAYFPDKLFKVTTRSFVYNAYTDELKKLKGGPFVSKMVNEWKAKMQNTLSPAKRKMFLYTGHDSSVVNILSAFNVWEEQFPGYASMGIFELLRDRTTGDFGIQLYIKNSTLSTPLTIPGCDFFCPVDQALQLIDHILPKNRDEECKPVDPDFEDGGPSGP